MVYNNSNINKKHLPGGHGIHKVTIITFAVDKNTYHYKFSICNGSEGQYLYTEAVCIKCTSDGPTSL